MPPKPEHVAKIREWTTPRGGDPSLAKQWRAAAGLTATSAAGALGVGIRTLTRWETGRAQPQGRYLADYYRFLNRIRPKEGESQ
ncbi:MAG TPA: helix-turn-helix transcriptional regulator [Pseudonocardiaceae bacterium]|jgi:transcriptional regulator with XRE-family HTH domain|nr:helix-turn-helix transcriptional regulator [Pseudonocardiaceae bacterium]